MLIFSLKMIFRPYQFYLGEWGGWFMESMENPILFFEGFRYCNSKWIKIRFTLTSLHWATLSVATVNLQGSELTWSTKRLSLAALDFQYSSSSCGPALSVSSLNCSLSRRTSYMFFIQSLVQLIHVTILLVGWNKTISFSSLFAPRFFFQWWKSGFFLKETANCSGLASGLRCDRVCERR